MCGKFPIWLSLLDGFQRIPTAVKPSQPLHKQLLHSDTLLYITGILWSLTMGEEENTANLERQLGVNNEVNDVTVLGSPRTRVGDEKQVIVL